MTFGGVLLDIFNLNRLAWIATALLIWTSGALYHRAQQLNEVCGAFAFAVDLEYTKQPQTLEQRAMNLCQERQANE